MRERIHSENGRHTIEGGIQKKENLHWDSLERKPWQPKQYSSLYPNSEYYVRKRKQPIAPIDSGDDFNFWNHFGFNKDWEIASKETGETIITGKKERVLQMFRGDRNGVQTQKPE